MFGVTVRPGQLIHADQHGFLVCQEHRRLLFLLDLYIHTIASHLSKLFNKVVPEDDEEKLEEATSFMDRQIVVVEVAVVVVVVAVGVVVVAVIV